MNNPNKNRDRTILLALIPVIGAIIVAIIANSDKLFHSKVSSTTLKRQESEDNSNAFCSKINQVVTASYTDFAEITAELKSSDSTEDDYYSKIKFDGLESEIVFDKSGYPPEFDLYLYDGGDINKADDIISHYTAEISNCFHFQMTERKEESIDHRAFVYTYFKGNTEIDITDVFFKNGKLRTITLSIQKKK
ncbi:MAG TPA: hypothetical protein VHB70_18970 [Parafilimonas sp.]|nr:hypothetical protein [Parafilimonas sp.]